MMIKNEDKDKCVGNWTLLFCKTVVWRSRTEEDTYLVILLYSLGFSEKKREGDFFIFLKRSFFGGGFFGGNSCVESVYRQLTWLVQTMCIYFLFCCFFFCNSHWIFGEIHSMLRGKVLRRLSVVFLLFLLNPLWNYVFFLFFPPSIFLFRSGWYLFRQNINR